MKTIWFGSATASARPVCCTYTPRYGNTRGVAATHSSVLLCLHMPSHTTSHTATVSVVRRGRAWKSVMLMHRVHQDVRSPHLRHSSAENNRAHRTSDTQGGEVQSASISPHHAELLWVQSERFELPAPFWRSITKSFDS